MMDATINCDCAAVKARDKAVESAASMVIGLAVTMLLAASVEVVMSSRSCGMALRYSSTARSSALALDRALRRMR